MSVLLPVMKVAPAAYTAFLLCGSNFAHSSRVEQIPCVMKYDMEIVVDSFHFKFLSMSPHAEVIYHVDGVRFRRF
jgi:hypothetical protein